MNKLDEIIKAYWFTINVMIDNNSELDEDLYDELFDYYCSIGLIPYGIAKARTSDPYNWVYNQLLKDLEEYNKWENEYGN